MEERISFTDMREEHLDGAARVLTRAFLELNEIWKVYAPTYDQVYPVIRGKIMPSVKSNWSFVHVVLGRS
jgi:hypothetical protein